MSLYRWWYDIYLCFVDALYMAKYYISELILKCVNETRTQMFMALQSDKRTYEKVFINDTDIIHPMDGKSSQIQTCIQFGNL